MGMFDAPENPSAGKFEAPDPGRFDAPAPRRTGAWAIPALVLLLYLLRFELHSVKAKGWIAAAVTAGIVAIGIAEILIAKKRRDDRQEHDPSTPPHITR